MKDSDIITFFNNIDKFTSFERKRKIYDLTNNLDIDLLKDLRDEFESFYTKKIQQIGKEIRKGKDDNNQESMIIKEYYFTKLTIDNTSTLNTTFDDFLEKNDFSYIKEISEKTAPFMYELDGLRKRAKKKSKNLLPKINVIEETIDYSESNITSKIIFLNKLGVLDFLKNYETSKISVNKVATVLSAITGGRATTIQSMINPILNDDGVDDKNNPMNSLKTVDVVENKLLQIGFKPKK